MKFRVWDNQLKQYFDDGKIEYKYLSLSLAMSGKINEDYIEGANANRWCIEFSTGLNDSKGVEIFEGDTGEITFASGLKLNGRVCFIDGCFYLVWKQAPILADRRDYLKCYTANHAFRITGNIHEEAV